MKGLVAYESRSGATEAYARWLAEATGFELVRARKARGLEGYDVIVVGSCVRVYKPALSAWLLRNRRVLTERKAVLFTVAGASSADPKRDEWLKTGLGDLAATLPHFPLDGKIRFADMTPLDRFLMRLGARMAAKDNPEQGKAMLREFDRVDRATLEPIFRHLEGLGVAVRRP
jgi:menaquinone-dependent protoporphyrinogen IX oxidase